MFLDVRVDVFLAEHELVLHTEGPDDGDLFGVHEAGDGSVREPDAFRDLGGGQQVWYCWDSVFVHVSNPRRLVA